MLSKQNKILQYKKHIAKEDQVSFHAGTNYHAYDFMGAHLAIENGINGVRFTTWAPHTKNIYIVSVFINITWTKKVR